MITHFAILMSDDGVVKTYEFYNYQNGKTFAMLKLYGDNSHEEILSEFIDDLSGCLFDIVSNFSYTTNVIPGAAPEYDGYHKHNYDDIRGWKKRVGREKQLNKLGI